MNFAARVEGVLTGIGARTSPETIHKLNAALNYLKVGRWMRDQGHDDVPRYRWPTVVQERTAAEVADEKVLYLEFGVWKGASMRVWSKGLRHPEAILHGFDSFKGLPEGWKVTHPAGTFSVEGEIPQIDDARVKFFPGWFSDTLPSYQWPEGYERLVVAIDADLYSSTIEVLDWVEDRLAVGSYVYFDELNDPEHELRAFDEFIRRTGMRFRAVAASIEFGAVSFQRVG